MCPVADIFNHKPSVVQLGSGFEVAELQDAAVSSSAASSPAASEEPPAGADAASVSEALPTASGAAAVSAKLSAQARAACASDDVYADSAAAAVSAQLSAGELAATISEGPPADADAALVSQELCAGSGAIAASAQPSADADAAVASRELSSGADAAAASQELSGHVGAPFALSQLSADAASGGGRSEAGSDAAMSSHDAAPAARPLTDNVAAAFPAPEHGQPDAAFFGSFPEANLQLQFAICDEVLSSTAVLNLHKADTAEPDVAVTVSAKRQKINNANAPGSALAPAADASQSHDAQNIAGDSALRGAEEHNTREVLHIIAAQDVPAGAEVHNTYGEHGNDALLCKYGFALENNVFHAVRVTASEIVAAMRDVCSTSMQAEHLAAVLPLLFGDAAEQSRDSAQSGEACSGALDASASDVDLRDHVDGASEQDFEVFGRGFIDAGLAALLLLVPDKQLLGQIDSDAGSLQLDLSAELSDLGIDTGVPSSSNFKEKSTLKCYSIHDSYTPADVLGCHKVSK